MPNEDRRLRRVYRLEYAGNLLELQGRSLAATAEETQRRLGRRLLWKRADWPGGVAVIAASWVDERARNGGFGPADPHESMWVHVPVNETERVDEAPPADTVTGAAVDTASSRVLADADAMLRRAEVEATEERMARLQAQVELAWAHADVAVQGRDRFGEENDRLKLAIQALTGAPVP